MEVMEKVEGPAFYYTISDIVAATSYALVKCCKLLPNDLSGILKAERIWLVENQLVPPLVNIPSYVLYAAPENVVANYISKMVHELPEIKILDASIDLDGLRIEIMIILKRNEKS